MKQTSVTRATLGRLPLYLQYLRTQPADTGSHVSATTIAKALGLGEVQVRKDLSSVSGAGKPKTGYVTSELIDKLETFLGYHTQSKAVIVGVGKLGRALLEYDGFKNYGLEITAAFDRDSGKSGILSSGKVVYPIEQLESYCKQEKIQIGIITVPELAAQAVCDRMVQSGIKAIWSFAPCQLTVPEGVLLQQENLALSLAYLNIQKENNKEQEI